MVDRARVIERVATGARVEGTAQYESVQGPLFRCRLFPNETPETDSGVRAGRRVLVDGPHVIVGITDVNGDRIAVGDIGPNVQLEIATLNMGTDVWQVSAQPQPLLTKKKVLGYYFPVRRVSVAGATANGS